MLKIIVILKVLITWSAALTPAIASDSLNTTEKSPNAVSIAAEITANIILKALSDHDGSVDHNYSGRSVYQ